MSPAAFPVVLLLFGAEFATLMQPTRLRRRALPWLVSGTAVVLAVMALLGMDLRFVLALPFLMLWMSLGFVLAKKCRRCGMPRMQRGMAAAKFCGSCGAAWDESSA